jgi:AraC-like DNA-binding protein
MVRRVPAGLTIPALCAAIDSLSQPACLIHSLRTCAEWPMHAAADAHDANRPMHSQAYHDRLNRVIDHVREHLHEPLTVARLAQVACFSPYHFHRVFAATMGETVGAFVRRARLERAAQLLRASPRRRLGSAALEAGFSFFSDFSRAFRRHFGIAPSTWDRCSRLEFRGNPRAGDESGADVLRGWINEDAGPVPFPEIGQLPPLTLAYVRVVDATADGALQRGYHRLLEWLRGCGHICTASGCLDPAGSRSIFRHSSGITICRARGDGTSGTSTAACRSRRWRRLRTDWREERAAFRGQTRPAVSEEVGPTASVWRLGGAPFPRLRGSRDMPATARGTAPSDPHSRVRG